ncbi:MAG TPA: hypothetical protein PK733_01075 [Clostridiales bacterium]|nr:hypothetical protein [Clostridiales bacterium]
MESMRFKRFVWMLNEEDKGFALKDVPGGYVRIEVRESKGKFYAMVQNLKENRGKDKYSIYIMRHRNSEIYPVKVGNIQVNDGRGLLLWDFDPNYVGGSIYPITDFNMAAVILDGDNYNAGTIQCPLAAYSAGKVKWKEAFENYVKRKKEAEVAADHSKKEKSIIIEKQKTDESGSTSEREEHPLKEEYEINRNYAEEHTIDEILSIVDDANTDNKHEVYSVDDIYSKYTGKVESKYSFTENIPGIDELTCGKIYPGCISEFNSNSNNREETAQPDTEQPVPDETERTAQPDAEQPVPDETERTAQPDMEQPVQPDIEQTVQDNNIYERKKNKPDINKLVQCFDKEFKRYDPFNVRRRDYKWWKVTSPVNLINLLEQCDINVPRIFNPSIIMSYFKYRYLIAGIFSSRKRGRDYFVCGIPGTHNIDDSPFGNLCRWVQVERNRSKYGAFGYWVAYIDPHTGELLRFS